MTQQYQEIGDDEVRSFFGGAFAQQQMVQQPLTSAPPARPVAPPVSDLKAQKPNMKAMAESVLATQEQMKDRPVAEAKSVADDALNFVTQNWQAFAIPPAVVAGSWLLNKIGGESTGEKKSFADRIFRIGAPKDNLASPQATNRVDPVMDTNSPYQKPDIDVSKLDPQWKQILARSEENRISKERELELKRVERQQAAVDRINNVNSAIGNPTPKAPNPIPDVVAATVQPTVSLPKVPTVADIGKQTLGVAPVEAPVTTNQIVSEAITPPSEKKKGRPVGAKNLTPEQKAASQASKGTNMYLNMFGFDKNDPTSAKSLAAIESTNRFINEAMGGVAPASRDPLLNPQGDVGPSGKKFYSGTPEGYRNAYIPWLQQNLNTLPPETQSHVLQAMTKGQTGDISKIAKGLGLAGLIGASGAAFSAPSQTRGRDIANAIGEAVLPLGLTPSTLQSGVLPPEIVQQMMAERQKLGSPFRSVPPPQ